MGFLIFILALGPTPGKIVPKIKQTAKILYAIYFVLTVIEMILLKFAGMSWYDSIIHSWEQWLDQLEEELRL